MGRGNASLTRLHNDDEGINIFGAAAGKVLQSCLHIDDYDLVSLDQDVVEQPLEQYVLRTKTTAFGLGNVPYDEKLHTVVGHAIGVGDIINLGVQSKDAAEDPFF